MIGSITQWILETLRIHGAASVFIGVIIESVIVPIPSPLIIMGAGAIGKIDEKEFVKPAVWRLMGRVWEDAYTAPAGLVNGLTVSPTRRTHFVRVRCSTQNQLVAEPLNGQGSHQLRSLVEADGWVRVSTEEGPWPAGSRVFVKEEASRW